MPPEPFIVDPHDPQAPSREVWERLDAEQRRAVVASLPAEVPLELFMPEGDLHRKAKAGALDALDGFFKRIGRKVYLSSELTVYYPAEPRFVPDVLAVLDVEPGDRDKWVVLQEGRGLDWVLEVQVMGDRRKDLQLNVERSARLGITEYFVFDRMRQLLLGHRLPEPHARSYQPILPQHGFFPSTVLGLELGLDAGRLRFYFGKAPLPEADELVERLEAMVDDLVSKRQEAERRAEQEAARAEEERSRAEEERSRAEEERRRADDALQRLAELEAELLRLRGQR